MAKTPTDRFDEIPPELERVGAHRAPKRRGRGWIAFGWAVLATVVLIAAGLFGLSRINPQFSIDLPIGGGGDPSASPTDPDDPGVDPVTDPTTVDPALGLTISVLNGTETSGLQNAAGDQLVGAGWPDPARANATERDEETTTIYYASSDFEGIALGIAELLGTGRTVNSDAFPGAKITIVLGADYTPPSG